MPSWASKDLAYESLGIAVGIEMRKALEVSSRGCGGVYSAYMARTTIRMTCLGGRVLVERPRWAQQSKLCVVIWLQAARETRGFRRSRNCKRRVLCGS
jgi:hypothetical protein